MTEKKIREILKEHGVKTIRINNKLYAKGYYMQYRQIHSELLLVNPEKETVGNEPLFDWLGY